ncbi:RnfABCDGE type electron transport complex subunit G [Pseudomonas mucidolens]|uniref:Ion-translocating oxidoreductase complex subunit G n=1 Tax=Pseudomonas mucidolens TaxID=46679 RepID=A0A1H2LSE3_9PSED|nr:RnfABCDGE type electron transport complex subunit G [Pseudomonas mucidolens]SDU83784.1 electron transport complex protein RnfG [Pseudomonas mucidolens]SQH35603.1 electron transport complex protein RnfG [Pseudomonas mucidolens]
MKPTREIIIVMLVAIAGAGLTVALQQLTTQPIAAQQRDLQNRTLLDLLPLAGYDIQPLAHPLLASPVALNHSRLLNGYLATLSGQPSAVVLHSQTIGYNDSIELLIAIAGNGKVLGVKTLKQSETPGLGGHITEPGHPWLAAFKGLSPNTPQEPAWALRKDGGQFDQMAGATVTSRAVLNAIHDALGYFDEHRQHLLERPVDE